MQLRWLQSPLARNFQGITLCGLPRPPTDVADQVRILQTALEQAAQRRDVANRAVERVGSRDGNVRQSAGVEPDDAGAARRNLLIWANAVLPGPRILGLGDLAKRLKNPQITALLRALDRGCYAGDSWDGNALAAALPTLRLGEEKIGEKPRKLAPLYR